MPSFKTAYTTTKRVITTSKNPSLTDESYADECNISMMIEKYRVSKIPPRTIDVSYGHSPTIEDFQNAQYLLAEVKSNFEGLPSSIRDEFKNDVQNYLEYIGDKANLKDCYERGLIDPNSVDLREIYPERFQSIDSKSSSDSSVDVPPQPTEQVEKQ